MAWVAPKTWAAGEVLTASDMNQYVRENTTLLRAGHPNVAQTLFFARDDTEITVPANTVNNAINSGSFTLATPSLCIFFLTALFRADGNAAGNHDLLIDNVQVTSNRFHTYGTSGRTHVPLMHVMELAAGAHTWAVRATAEALNVLVSMRYRTAWALAGIEP